MENESKEYLVDYKNRALRWVNNNILLFRLKSVSKMSKLVSMAIMALAVCLLGSMILLFISFMGGYYFTELFGSHTLGFGLVALIYLILFLILIKFGKNFIRNKIASVVIDVIFEKTAKDDEDEE